MCSITDSHLTLPVTSLSCTGTTTGETRWAHTQAHTLTAAVTTQCNSQPCRGYGCGRSLILSLCLCVQLCFGADVFPERQRGAAVPLAVTGLRSRLPPRGFCENHQVLHRGRSQQGVPATHGKPRSRFSRRLNHDERMPFKCLVFHFQKWSSAWCWLAACCWSSSSFYSASSAARRSRWGARGTRRWSTRMLERTPDTSTDSCLEGPQASPPGKAATTLSFKLFQDICDIFINWLWKLILKFQFGFGSKVLETKGTWLQGWNCLTAQLTGCFFLFVGKFSKIKRTRIWAMLFHLYFFCVIWWRKVDDGELMVGFQMTLNFSSNFWTLTEMPYISTEGLFAHDAAGTAAFSGCSSATSTKCFLILLPHVIKTDLLQDKKGNSNAEWMISAAAQCHLQCENIWNSICDSLFGISCIISLFCLIL